MNLFAYGTLMDEEIMARVSGFRPDCLPATLVDHRRHALHNKTYPALVPAQGAKVTGILYRDLPETAWQALDLFEGEMYQRVLIQATTDEGRSLNAETYLLRPEFHHLLAEREWDYENFLRADKEEFKAEYCGFEQHD